MENFPLFLDVEVTNACNLKCPFCATTIWNKKFKKGFIEKSHVEKIIDEGVKEGLYGVKFNIRGEPLLHPLIDHFVKYAKDRNLVDVYFNTNALLLTQDMSHKLIDAKLDRISISFEGHTKEVYENNRVGSDYEVVLENIKNLQSIKKKMKVDYPKVRVQTVRLPGVDLDEYEKFWEDLADEIACLDYKDMGEKNKGVISSWRCPELWQRMAILWDGDIFPCNHDDEMLANLGNISSTSIKEAWVSDKIRYIREAHMSGNAHLIDACNGCYLRNSEISKNKGE